MEPMVTISLRDYYVIQELEAEVYNLKLDRDVYAERWKEALKELETKQKHISSLETIIAEYERDFVRR